MKREQQKAFLRTIARWVTKRNGELASRIESLERKIYEVEQRGVFYRGVYQRSMDYKRGDLVTFEGSMWHAVRDSTDQPGESLDWQLAVKKGRDERGWRDEQ